MKTMILIPAILSILTIVGAFPVVFASHATPLEGHMAGTGVATSQTSNNITATVYLTHLGKSMLTGTTMVTGTNECHGFTGHEQDTITSASGDKIFLTGSGTSCPTSTNPPMFQDTVTFTVTGGTGRFTHATGSGTTQTTITITSANGASSFTADIDGTISY